MAPRTREQSLDYRKEEVSVIMSRWKSAESCSLVGVGSVGKSNLLQHLANPKVQAEYMKLSSTDHFKAILIDPSMLSPLPPPAQADDSQIRCWTAYELMLHRLYMAFHQSDTLDEAEKQALQNAYSRLQDGTNPLYAFMGLRYLELGLDIVLTKGVQIVFMFDEFEAMLKNLPAKFFLTLRGLRDVNKTQLSYLTFMRSPIETALAQLQSNLSGIEEFTELFADNTLYIGPYSDRDARRMVDDLVERNPQQGVMDEYIKTFLVWATGGFAGLLRASFRVWPQISPASLSSSVIMTKNEDLARQMSKTEPIQAECKTLWQSLSEKEQYILKVAAGLKNYKASAEAASAAAVLKKKKLLAVDKDSPGELVITPPLLLYYIQGLPAHDGANSTSARS